MVTAWLKAAAAWTVRNWKLLLFPIGILVWIAGRASSRKTVVLQSPELEEHFELKRRLDEEATAKKVEAAQKHAAATRKATEVYLDKTKQVEEQAAQRVAELQTDPDALNDFLKQTGKDVRTKR
jgi:hypothetical protein